MIKLYDAQTDVEIGEITQEQLNYLFEDLEEESAEDTDYYINLDTLDMFAQQGVDPALIALLRKALGDRQNLREEFDVDQVVVQLANGALSVQLLAATPKVTGLPAAAAHEFFPHRRGLRRGPGVGDGATFGRARLRIFGRQAVNPPLNDLLLDRREDRHHRSTKPDQPVQQGALVRLAGSDPRRLSQRVEDGRAVERLGIEVLVNPPRSESPVAVIAARVGRLAANEVDHLLPRIGWAARRRTAGRIEPFGPHVDAGSETSEQPRRCRRPMRRIDFCQETNGRFAGLLTSGLEMLRVEVVAERRKRVRLARVADERGAEGKQPEKLPRQVHAQDLERQGARELPDTQQKERESEARFLKVAAPGERVRRHVFRRCTQTAVHGAVVRHEMATGVCNEGTQLMLIETGQRRTNAGVRRGDPEPTLQPAAVNERRRHVLDEVMKNLAASQIFA